MKVGDLVREKWKGGRLGVVVSEQRPRPHRWASPSRPIVDVLLTREAIKVVRDVDTLELISETR